MTWTGAGGIGAAASLALGVAGFLLCRRMLPKNPGILGEGSEEQRESNPAPPWRGGTWT